MAEHVLSDDNKKNKDFEIIEQLVNNLHKSNIKISVNDLGAGSKINSKKNRSISEITKNTAIPAKYGRLLYRLIQWGQCENILELGTSMGISTAYLSLASSKNSKIHSIEGDKNSIEQAKKNLSKIGPVDKIEFHLGNFDEVLSPILNQMKNVDLVLMDGNHKKAATLRYFKQISPYLHKNSIVILDDIRWSREMLEAWKEIKSKSEVRCSIDLFRMGLLFFKKELLKPQHISYKY